MDLPQASIAISSDIVDSSPGGYPRHADLLQALEHAIGVVIGKGPYPDGWIRRNRGDAELTLAPAHVPSAWVLADFLTQLRIVLLADNRNKGDGHQLRVRVGVDCGDVLIDASREPRGGDPLVIAKRLRDCDAAQEAVRLLPSAPVVAVVSDPVYQRAVPYQASGLEPHMFRRIPARVAGKDFTAQAWLYVPGHQPPEVPATGEDAPAGRPDPSPPQPAPGKPSRPAGDRSTFSIGSQEVYGASAIGDGAQATNHGPIRIERGGT